MKPNVRFLRRGLVIFMGLILVAVSIIQIVNNAGPLWLNVIFAGLGVFEIVLAIFMMRLDIKTAKEEKLNS
jgi:uncharacterized membrane protein